MAITSKDVLRVEFFMTVNFVIELFFETSKFAFRTFP